jgi:hypothetical protein
MTGRGEKLGGDPWIGQLTGWGLCREPFFSGAMDSLNFVHNYVKGYHIRLVVSTYTCLVDVNT